MVQIDIPAEYGYVLAVTGAMWFQQNIMFVIPVAMQRKKTGIQPPSLYPRDSEIKALKLTEEDVLTYNCTQRVHQNNLEFMGIFLPIFLVAGLAAPVNVAIAGAVVFAGRCATGVGYLLGPKKRAFGAWFHFGEFYVVYQFGKFAYSLIQQV
jgi:glutathione S-transferase